MAEHFDPSNTHFTALYSANREEWLQQRLTTLTATDAAKIWLSPTPGTFRDVKENKRNFKPLKETKALAHGHEREPKIIRTVADTLGLDLRQNEQLWINSTDSRFGATPDGFEVAHTTDKKGEEKETFSGILVECKTHNTRFTDEDFDTLPRRAVRYFEKDEEGIFRDMSTREPFDGHIPDLHMGQMMWQRITAGGNIKSQNNSTYYCVETHEDFNPKTFELSILKVEFTDAELQSVIDAAEKYYESDDEYRKNEAQVNALIEEYGTILAYEKYWKSEKDRVSNEMRKLLGAGTMEAAFGSDIGKVTASYRTTQSLDKTKLEKEHPGLLAKYTTPKRGDRPVVTITPNSKLKKKLAEDVAQRVNPAVKTTTPKLK